MSLADLYKTLHSVHVRDVLRSVNVLSLREHNSLEEAVKLLTANNIVAAPVLAKDGSSILGMIDMFDIVSYIVSVCPDKTVLSQKKSFSDLEICGMTISFTEVSKVINFSAKDPYVPVFENNPVTMVVALFAQGIHRIPVVDATGALVGILSQTDLVKYLSEHLSFVSSSLLTTDKPGVSEAHWTENIGRTVAGDGWHCYGAYQCTCDRLLGGTFQKFSQRSCVNWLQRRSSRKF